MKSGIINELRASASANIGHKPSYSMVESSSEIPSVNALGRASCLLPAPSSQSTPTVVPNRRIDPRRGDALAMARSSPETSGKGWRWITERYREAAPFIWRGASADCGDPGRRGVDVGRRRCGRRVRLRFSRACEAAAVLVRCGDRGWDRGRR